MGGICEESRFEDCSKRTELADPWVPNRAGPWDDGRTGSVDIGTEKGLKAGEPRGLLVVSCCFFCCSAIILSAGRRRLAGSGLLGVDSRSRKETNSSEKDCGGKFGLLIIRKRGNLWQA